jgi:hypothetical protein
VTIRLISIAAILFLAGCDHRKELEVLRKEQEESSRRIKEIQRNDRIEREGEAERNMESYLR